MVLCGDDGGGGGGGGCWVVYGGGCCDGWKGDRDGCVWRCRSYGCHDCRGEWWSVWGRSGGMFERGLRCWRGVVETSMAGKDRALIG